MLHMAIMGSLATAGVGLLDAQRLCRAKRGVAGAFTLALWGPVLYGGHGGGSIRVALANNI